ncbi:MAG TPA: hypothetical protein GXX33_00010 [Firmicutes bacterium]|nr:hypothetical protein [Bacillota bacterium]
MINVDFINHILEKFRSPHLTIYITDAETRILSATNEERIGQTSRTASYIISIMRPATIESNAAESTDAGVVVYGTPVMKENNLFGTVIVRGPAGAAVQTGNTIKMLLEITLEFLYSANEQTDSHSPEYKMAQIASQILSDHVDKEKLYSLMYSHELDPQLLRTVICIRLNYYQTSYFNINLNLGYQSSIEQLRETVFQRIRANRYLNSQDLVYTADRNTILILKSFIPSPDISRIYLALDVICRDLAASLSSFSGFSFSIAYGNLYEDITQLRKSWLEAIETLEIGQETDPNAQFYSLETLLFDNVCLHLQPQIINKFLLPALKKLTRKDGTLPQDLIETCEAFVDNCMNLSVTAAKTRIHRNTISARLQKMKNLTNLDPVSSFRDAFLVKMLALYVRHNNIKQI